MKLNIKIITGLFLLLLMLITSETIIAQNNEGTAAFTEDASDNLKKKKTDDTFFAIQIDKLSDKFFIRLVINIIAAFILIRLIYFPNYRKKELFFTFFIFNLIIFLIAYLLNKVDMGIGAAFGLFAVFSMLRYRTENISAKDMTYLFLAIAIGLLTAISKASAFELSLLNGIILLTTYGMESNLFLKKESSKSIKYENIEMIKPENHAALINDLKKRTGLNIHRVGIEKVDFLKDTANVMLYYYDEKQLAKQSTIPIEIKSDIKKDLN